MTRQIQQLIGVIIVTDLRDQQITVTQRDQLTSVTDPCDHLVTETNRKSADNDDWSGKFAYHVNCLARSAEWLFGEIRWLRKLIEKILWRWLIDESADQVTIRNLSQLVDLENWSERSEAHGDWSDDFS